MKYQTSNIYFFWVDSEATPFFNSIFQLDNMVNIGEIKVEKITMI